MLLPVCLGGGELEQADVLLELERQLVLGALVVGAHDGQQDLVAAVLRGLAVVVLLGHVQHELGPDCAHGHRFDLVQGDAPLYVLGALEVRYGAVRDEQVALLALFVVVEFEELAAEQHALAGLELGGDALLAHQLEVVDHVGKLVHHLRSGFCSNILDCFKSEGEFGCLCAIICISLFILNKR